MASHRSRRCSIWLPLCLLTLTTACDGGGGHGNSLATSPGGFGLLFDQPDVQAATAPPLRQRLDAWTLEAWIVQMQSGSSTDTICVEITSQSILNGAIRLGVRANGFTLSGLYKAPGSAQTPLKGLAILGEWAHYAMTCDGQILRYYVNGVLEAADGIYPETFIADGPIRLGGKGFADFKIDEVRFWNYARSTQQIQDAMSWRVHPETPGLLLNYQFEKGEGNQFVDSGILGRHGSFGTVPIKWTEGAPVR